MKPYWRSLALFLAVLPVARPLPTAPARRPEPQIRLVVLVAVDQMRADYWTRFRDQYTGGFRYLAARGRSYSEAHQAHACTATAPGHSTMLTGAFPGRNGIIGNDWYDRDKKRGVTSVTASNTAGGGHDSAAPTPRALRATALGDWLLQSEPRAKAFSFSRKDRAAILMGGQKPTGAFWYDSSKGVFTTSEYYAKTLPGWLQAFNAQKPTHKYFGRVWDRLRPPSAYRGSTPDDQEGEGRLAGRRTFPYRYAGGRKPDSKFYSYIISTPFMDELTLEAARRAVSAEKLGRRGVTDLLAVSLSSTDAVGHLFGPQSQEVQDLMFRLDRMLDGFFKFLDRNVGLEHVVIVLTGDHGVASLPEVKNPDGITKRQGSDLKRTIQEAEAFLVQSYGPGPWIEREYDWNVYLNLETIRAHGLSQAEVEQRLAGFLRRDPLLADVFTRTELASGRPHGSSYAALYAACFDPQRSGDLVLQPREKILFSSSPAGTTHGSPYRFDTHVPLVFAGPGIEPGTVDAPVRTVDIAPTIAVLIGVPVPVEVDGRPVPGLKKE